MPGNATVGQFVVGDGTLVGQTELSATVTPGKAKLVLTGKTYDALIYTGDFKVAAFTVKPKLLLAGKQTTIFADSTVVSGKSRLLLNGKAFILVIPEFAHMGRSALVLNGEPFALGVGGIVTVGKPTLYLQGKALGAAVPGLTPSVPWDLILTPSVPVEALLVPSVPQSLDLVPTVEEFR
jgi:hypothetical protein